MSVTVPDWVISSAVRYALDRSSYVVTDTINLVREKWVELSPETHKVIIRDVQEKFTDGVFGSKHRRLYSDVPDDLVDAWRELWRWMKHDGPRAVLIADVRRAEEEVAEWLKE